MPNYGTAELVAEGGAPVQVLEEHAEEMVEVLACYFPIVYTPPLGAPGVITRAQLVSGVEAALAAAPSLAPHVIPLILQKLSSSLRHGLHVCGMPEPQQTGSCLHQCVLLVLYVLLSWPALPNVA